MGNLMSKEDPYVHSRIENFNNFYFDISGFDTKNDKANQAYDERLAALAKMRDALKAAADEFMAPETDWLKFSKELLDNPNTYRGIILEALRNPAILNRMTGKTEQISLEAYNEANRTGLKTFFKYIDKRINNGVTQLSLSSVKDLIGTALGSGFYSMTGAQQRTRITGVFGASLTKELANKFSRSYKRDSDVLEEILENLTYKAFEKSGIPIQSAFDLIWGDIEAYFYQEVGGRKISHKKGQSPEDFLSKVKTSMRSMLDKQYTNKAVASGAIGEIGPVAVLTSDAEYQEVYEVTWTGKDSYEKLAEQYLTDSQREASRQRFNDEGKMSPHDIIISKNGKQIAIQVKNILGIMDTVKSRDINRFFQVKGDIRFTELLLKMASISKVPDSLLEQFSYLVANLVWFNKEGAKLYGRQKKKSENRARNILQEDLGPQIREIERIMGLTAMDFLGMTISEENEVIITDLSNVFYLFGNQRLVPTYVFVDEIINRTREEKAQASIQMTLGSFTPQFSIDMLWANKKFAAKPEGGLIAGGDYTNPMLLSFGKWQGGSIISSLNVSRINSRIHTSLWQLERQSKESYQ